jgi:hypothetical protein
MDNVIPFAVRSDGHRSATFRLWVQGSDVYILSREVGRSVKVSLHGTGEWHIKVRQLESGLDSVVDSWPRPPARPSGLTPAFGILVPRSAVIVPIAATKGKQIRWFDIGSSAAAVAFNIVLTPNVNLIVEPPRVLVGSIPLAKPERAHVVGETLEELPEIRLPDPASFRPLRPGDTPEAAMQRAREAASLPGPLKVLVYGARDDGLRVFLDSAAEIRDAPPTPPTVPA